MSKDNLERALRKKRIYGESLTSQPLRGAQGLGSSTPTIAFARMHPVSPTHPGKVFGRFSGKDRKSLAGRLFPQSSETISID